MRNENTPNESNSDYPESVLLEAKLIHQDHRPFFIIKTFLFRKQWEDKYDPRRKAAVVAFAWLWLSPPHLAVSGGLITAIITIYLLDSQNNLIREQNAFFQEQIGNEDDRANAIEELSIQRRRTELVSILWNTDPSRYISNREKSEAVIEFIQIEKSVGNKILNLAGADLSGSIINNRDLSQCDFSGTDLTDCVWKNVDLTNSSISDCTLRNTEIVGDFSSCNIGRVIQNSMSLPEYTMIANSSLLNVEYFLKRICTTQAYIDASNFPCVVSNDQGIDSVSEAYDMQAKSLQFLMEYGFLAPAKTPLIEFSRGPYSIAESTMIINDVLEKNNWMNDLYDMTKTLSDLHLLRCTGVDICFVDENRESRDQSTRLEHTGSGFQFSNSVYFEDGRIYFFAFNMNTDN